MKIIELLNKIANGEEPPKLILFKDRQWSYDEKEKDYVNIFNEWLFDSHVISNIVNCEVEIIETIVYTAEISKSKENEMYIIERVDENGNIIMSKSEYKPTITYKQDDKIGKINIDIFDDNEITNIDKMKHLAIRINEIIDYINSTK